MDRVVKFSPDLQASQRALTKLHSFFQLSRGSLTRIGIILSYRLGRLVQLFQQLTCIASYYAVLRNNTLDCHRISSANRRGCRCICSLGIRTVEISSRLGRPVEYAG